MKLSLLSDIDMYHDLCPNGMRNFPQRSYCGMVVESDSSELGETGDRADRSQSLYQANPIQGLRRKKMAPCLKIDLLL
jgi:hypothetical protein